VVSPYVPNPVPTSFHLVQTILDHLGLKKDPLHFSRPKNPQNPRQIFKYPETKGSYFGYLDNLLKSQTSAGRSALHPHLAKCADKCFNTLRSVAITGENMLLLATIAKKPLFEDISEHLSGKCHGFLRNLKTSDAVLDYIMKTKENNPEGDLDFIYEILRTKPTSAWPKLFCMPEERLIVKGQLLATIPKLPMQWHIAHSLKITSLSSSVCNSIRVVSTSSLVTSIHIMETISVSYNSNGRANNSKQLSKPAIGEWESIEMCQLKDEAGKLIFKIITGGVEVHREENKQPMDFFDVNVYASRPDGEWPAQPGYIKDFVIESRD